MQNGVMIITVRDREHLRWIIEHNMSDYRYGKTEADNRYSDYSIGNIIFLRRDNGYLQYLTSIQVEHKSFPMEVSKEDLECLSYPLDGIDTNECDFLLIELMTHDYTIPSLTIDPSKLSEFLSDKYLAYGCGTFGVRELNECGVFAANKATISEESHELLSSVLLDVKRNDLSLKKDPKKKLLKVTFPEGTEFCYKSCTETFLSTIEYLGIQRVAHLDLTFYNTPLVAKTFSEKSCYRNFQKECNGLILLIPSANDNKYLLLKTISDKLNAGLRIAIGPFDPVSPAKKDTDKIKKPKKSKSLMVKLDDGHFICEENSRDTYVKTLMHIGIDKVRTLDDIIVLPGCRPVMTEVVKGKEQFQKYIGSGLYITIPQGSKKMYKYLKTISALAGVKLDVTLI